MSITETKLNHIGKIPENWKIVSLKQLFEVIGGSTPDSNNSMFWDNGNIEWITPKDMSVIKDGKIKGSERKITELGLRSCSTKLVPIGSLILSTRAPVGYVGIAENELSTNQGCKSLVNKYVTESRYYYYFFSILAEYLDYLSVGTTFKELPTRTLNSIKIPQPSLREQQEISNFLDQRVVQLDTLIQTKQNQIASLNEYKQSLISEVVTKGLNPDVKMKDSGVEWIGEIPEHWSVSRVKHFYDIILGKQVKAQQSAPTETLEPYLCSINVRWEGIDTENVKTMWFDQNEKNKLLLQKGDLIVCEGGDAGRSCIWDEEIENCYIQNAVHRVRGVNNKFLYYWMYFVKNLGYIDLICNKSTIMHFTISKFHELIFPKVPESEMHEIVERLDQVTKRMNETISLINSEIEQIQNYKQSLIFEAVTGKLDVA